ncbi:MAG: lycopene cyclase, partial [Maribacter sp.]|nr:lycopene cyclase [Maribacter sp.]
GLMLANALGKDAFFNDKSVLLLDKNPKNSNDRTWCFWEKGAGEFEPIVHQSWNTIFFGGQVYSKQLVIAPYTYKLIRGIDFYRYFIDKINSYSNIDFVNSKVLQVEEKNDIANVKTEAITYTCGQVFNSILEINKIQEQNKYPVLQQHFMGWVVKTKEPVFDPHVATFMDFSVDQKNNTRFMYALPFSKHSALLEYTLFSQNLLPKEDYENAIQEYLIKNLGCEDFEILEKEKGSIPMTNYKFHKHNTKRIQYIGTAGGWTKPSTGYTFFNTAKKTRSLVQSLKESKSITTLSSKWKFWFYDLLLLDILYKHNEKGHYIFETLFKNRSPQLIFKFLDEETNFWEDLQVISGCPKKEFLRAIYRRFIRKFS